MISTVTTTTSTIISSSAVSFAAALIGAGVVVINTSLLTKQLATVGPAGFKLFGRNLDIVILPLLFVFFFIIFMKVYEILF